MTEYVELSSRIIFQPVSLSTRFERTSLYAVRCLEAPLSTNQVLHESEGELERVEIRMYSDWVVATLLSYLEFLDFF